MKFPSSLFALTLLSVLALSGCNSSGKENQGPIHPTGPTLITTVKNGEPVVVDAEAGEVNSVWDGEGHTPPVTVQISESGEYCAFCLAIDKSDIVPMAGPLGEATRVPAPVTRSKNPVPLNDGETLVWIQYGKDEQGNPVEPDNIVRMTDYEGGSVFADGVVGATQLWGLVPSPDEKFLYTINGGDEGLIRKISVETGEVINVGTLIVKYPLDMDEEGRLAGGYVHELRVFEPATGTETTAFAFPAHDSTDCDYSSPDTPTGCFLKVESPRFSPDGSKVVFYSRSHSLLSEDSDGDIVVVELNDNNVFLKLTDDEIMDRYPVFGAKGDWVYWVRNGEDLVRKKADDTGDIEVVVQGGFSSPLDVAWID